MTKISYLKCPKIVKYYFEVLLKGCFKALKGRFKVIRAIISNCDKCKGDPCTEADAEEEILGSMSNLRLC